MINLVDPYYASSVNYPEIILAITEQLRIYLTDLLYSTDADIEDGVSPRVIMADIGATTDEGIRQATLEFGSNQSYPFTAYNLGEFEVVEDRRNTKGALSLHYSSSLDSFVSAIPVKQEILAITFTNNPGDDERVKKILLKEDFPYTMLYAPVEINGTTYQYPVKLESVPSKGNYAFGFVEYLRTNGIYDIVHNFNLYFYDLVLDTETVPIDEMTSNLDERSPIDDSLNSNIETKNYLRTSLPEISSTDPTEAETEVPVENSIFLNFNVTMDETSVENAITIDPYFEHYLIWDDDSKILIIDPYEDLTSGTLYSIAIDDTARAFDIHDVIEEFELTFTTET